MQLKIIAYLDWGAEFANSLSNEKRAAGTHAEARPMIGGDEERMLHQIAITGDSLSQSSAFTVLETIRRQTVRTPKKIALQFEKMEFVTYQ
ncbi:hypothetical protein BBP40_008881 [Aspergillus hancockii]|nr:hypothetical protein BBP40_008881 [Aspergillus hancockii]